MLRVLRRAIMLQITSTITAPTTAPINPAPSSLAQPGGDECAYDSKDRREDEPRRFVRAWVKELRDHARKEPDDDRPNDAHVTVPLPSLSEYSRASGLSSQTRQPGSHCRAYECVLTSSVSPSREDWLHRA